MQTDSSVTTKKPSIFSLLTPYRVPVFMLVVFALASNVFSLFFPKIISRGINAFAFGQFDAHVVVVQFVYVAVCVLVFTFIQNIIQTYTSERVAKDLRTTLAAKISRGSYVFVQNANPSKLLTHLTSDVDAVKMFVAQAVSSIISSIVIIIGASAMLLSINWKLGLAVIAILPIIAFTFITIFRKVRVLFVKSREVIDWLNNVINESILGAALIRVVYSRDNEHAKFDAANQNARAVGLKILGLFAAMIPIVTFVANAGTLIILALGGHYIIQGTLTIGDFAAFNSYVAILIFPIFIIGFMMNILSQATASYGRIADVLAADELAETGTLVRELTGQIAVDNVSVVYGEKNALKNASFTVNAGTRTAIIGPTAAGKSQLLYLLTGLTVPTEGVITFDGVPTAQFESTMLHRQVGFVFQDSIMFNMSIRENIAFSSTVTDASLEKAIATAELAEFIGTLPNGLDTLVSERGTSLSGGQKQRVMLARALALDPKILLLDDFTARVDGKTEQRILANIRANYPHLTLVSVTQKIAPVVDYDEIVLLMEGEVVAKGTHTQLMETCPEYVQIFNSQRSTHQYELRA